MTTLVMSAIAGMARFLKRARAESVRLGRVATALLIASSAVQPMLPATASALQHPADRAPASALLASPQPAGTGVIDYAGGYTSSAPARLKSAGIGVVVRYVGSRKWKCLSPAEAHQLRAAGLDIAVVYETKAGWMLGGRKAGIVAAKRARAAVVAAGGPRNTFIYFACDTPTHRYSVVNACLRGAASVIGAGRVGVYGSYAVCKNALAEGAAAKAWQTIAWSSGKVLPKAALYQTLHRPFGRVGLDYDTNLARADDFGQWSYTGPGTVSWNVGPAHTAVNLTSVDFANASNGWAVGDYGTVLHTPDAGATWDVQAAPTAERLTAVDFVGTNTGWAVGDGGTAIGTADGGLTWAQQPTPTGETLRSVRFSGTSSGWAVGDGGTVLRTADAGATWAAQSTPTSATLNGIDFATSKVACSVGATGTVLRTIDAGETWMLRPVSSSATLRAIDFVNSTTGWAVGDAGTVLRTRNGGSTWSRQSVPTTASLTAVNFIDDRTGWAVGAGGICLRTYDGGATWSRRSVPSTSRLASVKFTGPTSGWAVGADGTIAHATITGTSRFGTVAGVVTDASTGKHVTQVKITIGTQLSAPSAVNGSYAAARIKPGTVRVRFSDPRFITKKVYDVVVRAGMRTVVNVQLKRRIATSLSRPSLSPTAPLAGHLETITVNVSPSAAATDSATWLTGSHYERKTVRRRIRGRVRRVSVWYWRARINRVLYPISAGRVVTHSSFAAGKWRMRARFVGSGSYLSSKSRVRYFTVQ